MNNQAKKQLVDDFVSYTCTSREISQRFLSLAKWNMQDAINNFYDQGAPMPPPPQTIIPVGGTNDVQSFFNSYGKISQGENIKIINQDGLEKLFAQILRIDMSNIVIGHIMINVMQMKKAGQATKQHLYNLLKYTNCKTFSQVAKNIPKLEKQIRQRKDLFRKMYLAFFQFYSVTKVPTLDYEVAQQIWQTYFKGFIPYYDYFMQYLKTSKEKTFKVHKDLWKMMYQFASSFKDVASHSQSQGWPLFIDNFVAFLKTKNVK